MVYLSALWLPILLSAVIVFIASSIIHMVLQIHKNEYKKLPGEENILEAMRKEGVVPGEYMFPCAPSFKESGSPEMQEKYKRGPCGIMTVLPSKAPAMGKGLVLWFIFSLVISVFAAYIASRTLSVGTPYLTVFRITGTVAVLAYAISALPDYIWKGKPLGSTILHVVDGVIYGLLTAGVFGWLWPSQ
jgi:hypothetical protein